MKTGQFINYLAPFGTGHPSEHEATKLMDTADTLIKAGCKGVGITKKFSNQYKKAIIEVIFENYSTQLSPQ